MTFPIRGRVFFQDPTPYLPSHAPLCAPSSRPLRQTGETRERRPAEKHLDAGISQINGAFFQLAATAMPLVSFFVHQWRNRRPGEGLTNVLSNQGIGEHTVMSANLVTGINPRKRKQRHHKNAVEILSVTRSSIHYPTPLNLL